MVMNGFDTNFDADNEVYAVNTVANHFMHDPIRVEVGRLVRDRDEPAFRSFVRLRLIFQQVHQDLPQPAPVLPSAPISAPTFDAENAHYVLRAVCPKIGAETLRHPAL